MQIGKAQPIDSYKRFAPLGSSRHILLCLSISPLFANSAFSQSLLDADTAQNPTNLQATMTAADNTADPNPLPEIEPGRQNLPTNSIGRSNQNLDAVNSTGIRIGTMVLRSSMANQIFYENEKIGAKSEDRVYNQTTLDASLQSDWSRHSLTLQGSGTFEENIRGTLNENPSVNISADLNLELYDAVTANIQLSYDYSVEDRTDPNATSGASDQADINSFGLSTSLSKTEGILRGSLTGTLTREVHGDAVLGNTVISGDDRDLISAGITARLQYAANPVLMPFIEGEYSRTEYDQQLDDDGIARSYNSYALRFGLTKDISEKLNGEVALGYVINDYDDASLSSIKALSFDSTLNWSPLRGTSATLAFSTDVSPSTTIGESGSVLYALDGTLTKELTESVDVSIGTEYSFRDYVGISASNERTIYGVSAGLDWQINPHLSLNADAAYTKTQQNATSDIDEILLGLGLTLSR